KTWKVGPSGSVTKLFLERVLGVYLISAHVWRAAWATRPGFFLALACTARAVGYSQIKKTIDDGKAAASKRQAELEKQKNLAEIEKVKKENALLEERSKALEIHQKAFETKAQTEIDNLKKEQADFKKKFEESQESFVTRWVKYYRGS